MGRVTLIDCQTAGIAGDMLLGALIDAGAEIDPIRRTLDLIPRYYKKCKEIGFEAKQVTSHGFRATGISFDICESVNEIQAIEFLDVARKIARASDLSDRARAFAVNSINKIIEAEGRIHGMQVGDVHLHEAGSADTLADVFGVGQACDQLGIFDTDVYSTTVAVGGGTVEFSHGKLSNPPPAVLEMLREKAFPIVGGPAPIELATPTGISMLVSLVRKVVDQYPRMKPELVGYGAGKKDLPNAPNILRVVIGDAIGQGFATDTVNLLETNLDDVSGEVLGHTLQRLMDCGAKDAWLTPAQVKKSRPGHVLHAICDVSETERIARIIMEETGTLGVRYQAWNRLKLDRETTTLTVNIAGKEFNMKFKIAHDLAGRLVRIKPEFEDVRKVAGALEMSAREVSELALADARCILKESEKRG